MRRFACRTSRMPIRAYTLDLLASVNPVAQTLQLARVQMQQILKMNATGEDPGVTVGLDERETA